MAWAGVCLLRGRDGWFFLMDLNFALRHQISDAGQQAHALGFHSRYGYLFASHLLLEG